MKDKIGPLTAPRTKRPKRSGSAFITDLEVECGSQEAALHLARKFYRNSRLGLTKAGVTVTRYESHIEQRGQYKWVWVAKYVHTCVNEGAARSDCKRAIQQAFNGTHYRYKFLGGKFAWRAINQEQ